MSADADKQAILSDLDAALAQIENAKLAVSALSFAPLHNLPPAVALAIDPASGEASPDKPLAVTLTATASDPDGVLTQVTLMRGATLLATLTAAPFTFVDQVGYPGDYAYTAKALDDEGANVTSSEVALHVAAIVVQPPPPPPASDGTSIQLEDTGSGISRDTPFFALSDSPIGNVLRRGIRWRTPLAGAVLGQGTITTAGALSIALSEVPDGWLYLRVTKGGAINVYSRENSGAWPHIDVAYTDGTSATLACIGDATIDTSMSAPTGKDPTLRFGYGNTVVAKFEKPAKAVASATLVLTVFATVYGAPVTVQACVLNAQFSPEDPTVHYGLRHDNRLNAASVIELVDFANDDWIPKWYGNQSALPPRKAFWLPDKDLDTGEQFDGLRFGTCVEIDGVSVNTFIPDKLLIGGSAEFHFSKQVGHEFEEVYGQYRHRFGAGWHADSWFDATKGQWHYLQNGKLPGFTSGGGSAYSGAKCNGRNPWSLRGEHYASPFAPDSKYGSNHGRVPIGIYGYTYDQVINNPDPTQGLYGLDYKAVGNGEVGILDVGRDYWIDWYVKVNTPGLADGVTRIWVDGKLAYERTDWIMRLTPPYQVIGTDLAVEMFTMTLLIGGPVMPIPKRTCTYFDHWTIASEYIGPP